MRRLREFLQAYFRRISAPLADRLARMGISPNQVSVIGFLIAVLGAWLVGLGLLIAGGLVFAFGSLFDMLDGLVARRNGAGTPFGAFLDSTLDRIAEGLLFTALAYHFAVLHEPWLAALTVLAFLAASLTSYTRARAEGLGVDCSVGLVTRLERVVIICAGLVFGLAGPAVWVLVLLGAFTVFQRAFFVRRALSAQ